VSPHLISVLLIKKILAIPPNYMRLTLNYDRDIGAYRIDKITHLSMVVMMVVVALDDDEEEEVVLLMRRRWWC
jgi:hypothetical protein